MPKAPEGFEWQAVLKLDKPHTRMQNPPDSTELAAGQPPEQKPITSV